MKRGEKILNNISDFLKVVISDDKMIAELYCTEDYHNLTTVTESDLIQFLNDNKVTFGIDKAHIQLLLGKLDEDSFPLTIARGIKPVNGIDGKITYTLNISSDVSKNSEWNFRDVMRIPSVTKGEKLAVISLPTKGTPGKNVLGVELPARPGKPNQTRARKNVRFNENDLSFYSEIEGQVSVLPNAIEVHEVYQVDETLSMKTGNLDFVGSIVIRGDVPTGYTVRAGGDIKVFGIVEAAEVHAGGSLFISEGLAGLQKGTITAGGDIHIGYINQGKAEAGDSIYVENSILHSECIAKNQIYCQQGNIIGGTLSVGQLIEAKDIGNRLSTETMINFGTIKSVADEFNKLVNEKKSLIAVVKQLTTIGEKLANQDNRQDAKVRITLLRQRNSLEKTKKQIEDIDDQLSQMNAYLGQEENAVLNVRNYLYSNVIIAFGKYKRKINNKRQNVKVALDKNEIVLQALKN